MTPYTSLASSSKGRPVVGWAGGSVADGKVDGIVGGEFVKPLASPKATTIPELALRVFRGLPNRVWDAEGLRSGSDGSRDGREDVTLNRRLWPFHTMPILIVDAIAMPEKH